MGRKMLSQSYTTRLVQVWNSLATEAEDMSSNVIVALFTQLALDGRTGGDRCERPTRWIPDCETPPVLPE